MTIRVGQVLSAIVSLVLLGAGWFFFAPTQLGGSNAYVQIYGTSMQPRFHAGDLVIVRSTNSTFRVGDIAAYRNPTLGNHVVLHRIIEITGGRYVFKGDNNTFIDSYHPTRNQLVGHMWVHAPAVGKYLVWMHGPHLFLVAGIIALITLLLGAGFGSRRVVGRRGRADAQTRLPAAPAGSGRSLGALPATAAAALVAFAALAALSFARPLTTHAVAQGVYTQTGHFSYDAPSPEGARVYGSTTVTTGQPLFLSIVHNANFHFAYALSSAKIHSVSGTVALDAQVASPNGWKRTLHLAAPMSFSGDRTTITGGLSFRSLTKLLQRVDALSNLIGGTYTLTLLPKVHIHGIVGGNPVNDHFAPQLPLTLDPNELQLQQSSATGAGAAAALTQAASGSGSVTVASQITLLKLKVSVALARRISLVGAALAAILLLAGIVLGLRSRKADEHEQIARTYRDLIVAVEGLPATAAASVVRTTSIEGLARIADQTGRMVMHAEHAGLHTYFVEDSGIRYTFELGVGAEAPDTVPSAAESAALRVVRGA
jgi:signal peptidase I